MRRKPLTSDPAKVREWKAKHRGKLNRKKAVKRKNARRSAKEFRRAYGSRERVHAIQAMPCLICGALPSQNAHVRSRGAGGGAADIVPLCMAHHQEQHDAGIETFEERYSINLRDEARRTEVAWQEQHTKGG